MSKWNAGLLRALQLDSLVYDFWRDAQPGFSAEIMTPEEHLQDLKDYLQRHEIGFTVKVDDVDRCVGILDENEFCLI